MIWTERAMYARGFCFPLTNYIAALLRMARHNNRTKFHVFSSHFYTALKDKGPEGVTKWTKNKNINVFDKEIIFIPINETLHWSLCVVVNPGSIVNAFIEVEGDQDAWPGMYFFDSLKAHRKTVVAENVRKWLNSEYKRVYGSDETSELNHELRTKYNYEKNWKKLPFNKDTMPVESPTGKYLSTTVRWLSPSVRCSRHSKVPYQNNGWDCGVFVCRYAFAMLDLAKSERFLFGTDKRGVISSSQQFHFGMRDIARIREEMRTLIQGLTLVYRPWKEEEDRKARMEKAATRKAKALAASTTDTTTTTQSLNQTETRNEAVSKSCGQVAAAAAPASPAAPVGASLACPDDPARNDRRCDSPRSSAPSPALTALPAPGSTVVRASPVPPRHSSDLATDSSPAAPVGASLACPDDPARNDRRCDSPRSSAPSPALTALPAPGSTPLRASPAPPRHSSDLATDFAVAAVRESTPEQLDDDRCGDDLYPGETALELLSSAVAAKEGVVTASGRSKSKPPLPPPDADAEGFLTFGGGQHESMDWAVL